MAGLASSLTQIVDGTKAAPAKAAPAAPKTEA